MDTVAQPQNNSSEKVTRRVAKNGLAQMVRIGATLVSKLLIVVVIARTRGVADVGDFTVVMTFTLTLGFLDDWGLIMLLMREVAKARDKVHLYTDNTMTLCLVAGMFSVTIMGAVAKAIGYNQELVIAVYLTAIALVFDNLGNVYVSAFSGYERMELGAVAIVIQEASFLVIGVLVLYLKLPFLWLFVIFIASRIVGLIASLAIYYWLWRRVPRFGFHWPTIKYLGRTTLPFMVTTALAPVFVRFDVLMVAAYKGDTQVGLYEVASTLYYRMNVLARFYNLAMLPLIANQFPIIGDKVVGYVRQAMKYQLFISAPITLVMLVLGGPVIVAIYGPAFLPAELAFQILAGAIFLRLVDNTLAVSLTGMNMEFHRSILTATLAALNIGLNLYAIPRIGYVGAALTSVITEVCFFIGLYLLVRRRLPNPFGFDMVVRPFAAALIMVVPIWLLRSWPVWVLLPLSVLFYVPLAFLLKAMTFDELRTMMRTFKLDRLLPPALRRRWFPRPPAGPELPLPAAIDVLNSGD